jgi:uncharacterized membrane protein YidH (DUF202 family)
MARWSSAKETVVVAVRNWRLWLLQFVANAAIFLAFVAWLRFPDAHWWQLILQLFLVLLIAVAVLVLHGGTLNYYESAHQVKTASLSPAFLKAFKHAAAIAVLAFLVHFFEHLIGHLAHYQQTFPGYLRSGFPAWLRRMITESALDNAYALLLFMLVWVVLPGLLLPFALFASSRGFRGLVAFGDWRRAIANLLYWIALVVAAVIGVGSSGLIMSWKLNPKSSTLAGEQASLAIRLFFAYLLAIFAWLLTCSIVGRRATRGSGEASTQPQ